MEPGDDVDGCGRLSKSSMRNKVCTDEAPLCLRGRPLAALRAVAGAPAGLRLQAYPSVMPLLVQLGVVEARPMRAGGAERLWFLTPLGRRTAMMHGRDEA
ncbi:hypothetical protein KHHGKMAE_2763 [Methylobacterium persicinum]|nr:hypothetical protein KHHGKMAE_2763 [Methylobacterium persicinum]